MNIHFITLPSGFRVNPAHICGYRGISNIKKTMVIVDWEDGYGNKCITEDMTAEQLDSLLSPPQSPIVSPVIDLDRLKPGAPVHFKTPSGEHRHGILEFIGTNYGSAFLSIRSDGEQFTIFPEQQNISK